ncbi:MAG: zinc-binding dehydrogenase [Victivallales bacterium]|nr:zinc-binding dehydrogenase [Victivallales bacterium]
MKCKAIVFTAPGKVGLKNFNLPECGDNEVLAETIYSFVSPGTELRVLSGVSESNGRFPLIPGYSWVGRIIQVGSAVKGWSEGELVSGRNPMPIPGITQLWGGQASHHRCQVTGYDAVLKLPAGADPWDYITVEVAAISWRGVTCAFPAAGETAVVIGQGMIGAFNAKWLLYHGAKVIVLDLEETRLERARRWGVAAAIKASDSDIKERIMALCDGGADIVIESSASRSGAELATRILRQPVYRSLNKGYPVAAMHSNPHLWPRLVFQANYTHMIECSPSGNVGAEGVIIMKPGDRTVEDRLAVIERVRTKYLDVKDIIESATPVGKAAENYKTLKEKPGIMSALAFKW